MISARCCAASRSDVIIGLFIGVARQADSEAVEDYNTMVKNSLNSLMLI